MRLGLPARVARLRSRTVQIAQCAVGAGTAWWLAAEVFAHPSPVFAPVTAVIALGISFGQRRRRVVEVVVGVAVGVGVGNLLVVAIGPGAWQIALVVAVAMALAALLDTGPLIVNQAAVQATFVAALVPGTRLGVDRWLDAVIGGAVALLLATVVPRSTLERPADLAAALLHEVADLLRAGEAAARARDAGAAAAALDRARGTEVRLAALRAAAAEGLDVVAGTPWRRGARTRVHAVAALAVPLDRAVRDVRVLARRLQAAVEMDEVVPGVLLDVLGALAGAAEHLGGALARGAPVAHVVQDLLGVAGAAAGVPRSSLSADVVLAQARSCTVDLLQVAGLGTREALEQVRARTRAGWRGGAGAGTVGGVANTDPNDPDDVDQVWEDFHAAVNMTSRELADWLRTESASEGTEAFRDQAGPATGQQVLHVLSKRRTDVTVQDVEVMRAVDAAIRARRGEDLDSPVAGDAAWRHELMDLGHDPLKPA